jgi:hypothetical protein
MGVPAPSGRVVCLPLMGGFRVGGPWPPGWRLVRGPWLCRVAPHGAMAVVVPSAWAVTFQPIRWM